MKKWPKYLTGDHSHLLVCARHCRSFRDSAIVQAIKIEALKAWIGNNHAGELCE